MQHARREPVTSPLFRFSVPDKKSDNNSNQNSKIALKSRQLFLQCKPNTLFDFLWTQPALACLVSHHPATTNPHALLNWGLPSFLAPALGIFLASSARTFNTFFFSSPSKPCASLHTPSTHPCKPKPKPSQPLLCFCFWNLSCAWNGTFRAFHTCIR